MKELANNLFTLAVMCENEGTDNCDIILHTSRREINCHIEFSEIKNDELQAESEDEEC